MFQSFHGNFGKHNCQILISHRAVSISIANRLGNRRGASESLCPAEPGGRAGLGASRTGGSQQHTNIKVAPGLPELRPWQPLKYRIRSTAYVKA
jgi:hypothetical protein